MHLGNLGYRNIHNSIGGMRTTPLTEKGRQIDPEKEELKNRSWELFANRTIHWEKFGVVNRVKSYLSEAYETKIQEAFKEYIKKDLTEKITRRVQTYMDNNLNELRNEMRQVKDLTGEGLREVLSIIDNKEKALAKAFFTEETEKFEKEMLTRGNLKPGDLQAFLIIHPEYQNIETREQFADFQAAVYGRFGVGVERRI